MKSNVSYLLVIGLAYEVERCLLVGKMVYPPVLRVTDPITTSRFDSRHTNPEARIGHRRVNAHGKPGDHVGSG